MSEIVLCPHDRNGTRRIRSDTVFIVKHIFIEAVGVLGQTNHNSIQTLIIFGYETPQTSQ